MSSKPGFLKHSMAALRGEYETIRLIIVALIAVIKASP
jgi:hypothetical protein